MYNKSNGNLLAALLVHTGNNIAVGIFGPITQNMVFAVMKTFTVIAVITSKMWRKTDKLQTIQTIQSKHTVNPATTQEEINIEEESLTTPAMEVKKA